MNNAARLTLAGLLLTTAACRNEEPPRTEPLMRPVRYQKVMATGGTRVRIFSGAAIPGVETKISFKVSGTIRRLTVRVGDFVREGDLIAELDPRDYELQVEEVRASLAQAKAQARNAAADYERVRGLYEDNNASRAELDASRTKSESATATVAAIEKKLEMAQLQLSYTRLPSPVDGAVADVPVDVNENVSPGQAIAIINSGALPEVEVAIPESLITEVRRGDRVTVTFDAVQGRRYSAEVWEVGVAPTRSGTTFPVTVKLERENTQVLPGMAAEVAFQFGPGTGGARFILPPEAVAEDRQGRYVFTVEPAGENEGVVKRRPVQVGALVSDGLEVVDGLADGELVVTAGVSQITDGQRVKLLSEYRG